MAELRNTGNSPLTEQEDVRCEACELTAARMAYAAGLGASEWPAFIDRIAPCAECRQVWVLLGEPRTPRKIGVGVCNWGEIVGFVTGVMIVTVVIALTAFRVIR